VHLKLVFSGDDTFSNDGPFCSDRWDALLQAAGGAATTGRQRCYLSEVFSGDGIFSGGDILSGDDTFSWDGWMC
jgi:hypothetical protein